MKFDGKIIILLSACEILDEKVDLKG